MAHSEKNVSSNSGLTNKLQTELYFTLTMPTNVLHTRILVRLDTYRKIYLNFSSVLTKMKEAVVHRILENIGKLS